MLLVLLIPHLVLTAMVLLLTSIMVTDGRQRDRLLYNKTVLELSRILL